MYRLNIFFKFIKKVTKEILLILPIFNVIFIKLYFKIRKTKIKIHGYESDFFLMSNESYQKYNIKNLNNIKNITGVDKEFNYEYAFSKKIIDESSRDKIIFDVGAAYGHYSWLFSKLNKEVFCFEGDNLALFFLRKNLAKLNNIKIINKYVKESFSLNMFCKSNNLYPDLVKIDVEGDEIDILNNSGDLLKNKTKFIIEFHRRIILKKNNDKEIINNFFEIFKKNNYCIEYNGHHDAESLLNYGISDKIWSKSMPEKNDNFAIFCYPKE